MLEHLSKLLKEQHLADLTFKVNNERLKAHSIIVAAGSPVLSAMLQRNTTDDRTKVIEIKDTRPQVFKQLLQYLYTEKQPTLNMKEWPMIYWLLLTCTE